MVTKCELLGCTSTAALHHVCIAVDGDGEYLIKETHDVVRRRKVP